MTNIYVAEWHDQILDLWREQDAHSLKVLHLDFHCDLRGLLINRHTQRAYRIWDRNSDSDPGNFLAHAVLEDRVKNIRWVHDEPGGRQYDIGTVKYESDLSALPHRLTRALKRKSGIPIHYEVISYQDWDGLADGEILDIDWDFFASTEYSRDSIEHRIESFWKRNFSAKPRQIYVTYSPEYSHDTRDLFHRFVNTISDRFQGEVNYLPPDSQMAEHSNSIGRYLPSPLFRLVRHTYHATYLGLRRKGIY